MVELSFFLTCFSGMSGTSWPLTFSYTEPGRKSDNRCLWGNCTFSADPLSRRKNWIAAGLEVIFFSFILFFEGGGGGGGGEEREEHWYLYAKPFCFVFFFMGREEHWCLYAKPETSFTSSIRHFRNEKATGAEIHPAVVSGIVSRDVPVSHWAVFFPVTVPEVFAKVNSSQFLFLKMRIRWIFRSCAN